MKAIKTTRCRARIQAPVRSLRLIARSPTWASGPEPRLICEGFTDIVFFFVFLCIAKHISRNQSVTTSRLSPRQKLVGHRPLGRPVPAWIPLVEEEVQITSRCCKVIHCFSELCLPLQLTVGRWLLVNGRVIALSAHKGAGFVGTSILLTSLDFSLNGNISMVLVSRDTLNFFFKNFEKKYARSGVRTKDLLICNPPLSPIRYMRLVDELGTDAYENECVFAYSFLCSLFSMIPNLFLYFWGHFFESSVVSPSSWPK